MNVSVAETDRELLGIATEAAQEYFSPDDLRRLRDGGMSFDDIRSRWRILAKLGWVGMAVPEIRGGGGGGFADLTSVLRALGRNLATVPFVTSLISALAIDHGTEPGFHDRTLSDICQGETVVIPVFGHALDQSPGRRDGGTLIAQRAATGYVLTGVANRVADAPLADKFLVAARIELGCDEGQLGLFLVDSLADGLSMKQGLLIDSRPVGTVEFAAVTVDADAMVGEPSRTAASIQSAIDRAAVAAAAELFGVAEEAFDRTVAYLQVREQFGVPIGAFQALQHRAAQMLCSLELSGAILSHACAALDASSEDAADMASVCKARLSDAAVNVTEEAVQMHGGIGVCDECDIGLFLKRARVLELMLGDSAYHRDRYATRNNY
jgi:alkylation response protein AidB-like acyl-CoA dehydrogenase